MRLPASLGRAALALCAFACLPSTTTLRAADAPSFIKDVAPVLKEYCFACHSPKKKSGKFDMTSFEKLVAGGPAGEAVLPGDVKDSDLHALMVSTEERRMPPRKDNLSAVPAAKAEVVKNWIAAGAKLDAGIDPKADLVRELRVRWSPPEPPAKYPFPAVVTALAFLPDGKTLVSGAHHELTFWSVPDGKLVKRLRTRSERAHGIVVLPGGLLAVAGGRPGQEGDVCIYDPNAPAAKTVEGVAYLNGVSDPKVLKKSLFDTDDSILCVTASADGKTLAAGGCDRAVRVWDVADPMNPKLLQTVENHADWVLGVALSPDGKYLATASRDKTAKVWDLAAKESVVTFPDHQNPVSSVIFRADGKSAVSAGADNQVRNWKALGEAKQIKVFGGHGDDILKLVASADGKLWATASADKTVKTWDGEGKQLKTLTGLEDHVFAVAISPDGSLIAAGGYDGRVRLWKADASPVGVWVASPGLSLPPPEKK